MAMVIWDNDPSHHGTEPEQDQSWGKWHGRPKEDDWGNDGWGKDGKSKAGKAGKAKASSKGHDVAVKGPYGKGQGKGNEKGFGKEKHVQKKIKDELGETRFEERRFSVFSWWGSHTPPTPPPPVTRASVCSAGSSGGCGGGGDDDGGSDADDAKPF